MDTSEGQSQGPPQPYTKVDMQSSAPQQLQIMVAEQQQLNQQQQSNVGENDILNPSVFAKYCAPLSAGFVMYPSLQFMINKEKRQLTERPKRAKCNFILCTIILLASITFGTVILTLFTNIKLLAYVSYAVGALSIIGLLMNYKTAFVRGHVKHAADVYYNKEIDGILFDIRDNVIKRVGFIGDYGMTKEKETKPLETRNDYLHEPIIKILGKNRICTFDQLRIVTYEIKTVRRGSSNSYRYYVVLQYEPSNNKAYTRYVIDDVYSKPDMMAKYKKIKNVMMNIDPRWFSSGRCRDNGGRIGSSYSSYRDSLF